MPKTFRKSTPHAREEARGLEALSALGSIRCARVLSVSDSHIELEFIQSAAPTREFWTTFGRALARMHRVPQDSFGFEIDNHIGATPQKNPVARDAWADYFLDYRLMPMLERAELGEFDLLRIHSALRGHDVPSLIHGDLWSGNFLCTPEQEPVLIDPAPYRGHREADLAMTELFGGFAPEFYVAYHTEWPLEPGYQQRKEIYNLYHLLNHYILFGAAYRDRCLSTLRRLTSAPHA